METKTTMYAVYFKDKGYYAEKQPHYEWNFTDDINEALLYKTVHHAKARIDHGIGAHVIMPSGKNTAELVECEIESTLTVVDRKGVYTKPIKVHTPTIDLILSKYTT